MSAADVLTLAAGLPAVLILARRARRWQLARITDEQQRARNLAKWQRIDARHNRQNKRTAARMVRRAERIDAAHRHQQQQQNRARKRANKRHARAARRYAVTMRVLAGKGWNN